MDIRPIDFEESPQPPENIRIKNVKLRLFPDRRRVRVSIQLTPFEVPPNIEIDVLDDTKNRVANASIIEIGDPTMEVTIHLRGEVSAGKYSFTFNLGYQDLGEVHSHEVTLHVPDADSHSKG